MRKTIVGFGFVFLAIPLFLVPVLAQKALDADLEEFLITQEAKVEEGDRVLKASLVAIVPTSKRLIVKTDDDKTLALALAEGYQIKHGIRFVKAEDLKRDDVVVMVLRGDDLQVKEIHKYE